MDYENHVIFDGSATASDRLAYVQALVESIQEARAAGGEESLEARGGWESAHLVPPFRAWGLGLRA